MNINKSPAIPNLAEELTGVYLYVTGHFPYVFSILLHKWYLEVSAANNKGLYAQQLELESAEWWLELEI